MPFGVKTETARSCSCGRFLFYFFLLFLRSRAAHWATALMVSNTVEIIDNTMDKIS